MQSLKPTVKTFLAQTVKTWEAADPSLIEYLALTNRTIKKGDCPSLSSVLIISIKEQALTIRNLKEDHGVPHLSTPLLSPIQELLGGHRFFLST